MLTKTKKKIALLVAGIVILVIGAYCLMRFAFSIDILDRSGWVKKDGQVQCLDYFGRPRLGWQYVDGELYYFTPETGEMVTGWAEIEQNQYYFLENGVRAVGLQDIDGKTYYLGTDGKKTTGWQTIDDERYYFTETGIALSGWQTLEGERYYFSKQGKALTGWHTMEGKRYFFTSEGHTLAGWMEIEGARYRFDADGSAMVGWFEDKLGKYYFTEEGCIRANWLELDGRKYYFDEKGIMVTGWLTLENDRYYFRPDGAMAVGEVKIDGVSNFFTSKGKYVLLTNRWNPVPKDYVLNLVDIEGFQIDSGCRDALQAMMDDCRKAGYSCEINNSYRSRATQQYMWNRSVDAYMAAGMTYEEAAAETGKDTALPGHSEHQTGLAVDITGTKAMYDWLGENCWDYGFIVRYPVDRYAATGIIYEPWHFRYVGVELATELKELDLCMEEYMSMLTKNTK